MDTASGELQEAIDALTDEMLRADPALSEWYKYIIRNVIERDTGAAVMSWYRQRATSKLNGAKASERGLGDMSLVIATVGSIDPNSVCEDEGCAQRGELYKDHRVSHTAKGRKKFLRGGCPHCGGRLHNKNDSAQLIAFQCLWKQAFGEDARRTPVNALNLTMVAGKIGDGTIKAWADRALLLTITAAPPKVAAVSPPTAPAPVPTGSASPVAPPSPAKPAVPTVLPSPAVDEAHTPSAVPSAEALAAAKEKAEKKKAALAAALRGARVMP